MTRRRLDVLWLGLAAVAIAILDWPVRTLAPSTDLFDGAWHYVAHLWGQHLTALSGRIEFPYGPLGFLSLPELWFTGTAAAAWVFVGLLTVATAAVTLVVARRSLPWWAAGLLALLVVRGVVLLNAPVEVVPLVTTLAVLSWRPPSDRARYAAVAALAVVAAVTLLVKFSDGVETCGILLLAPFVWAKRQLLTVAAAATSMVVAVVGLWVVVTHGLGGLGRFVAGSWSLSGGYWAVTLDEPGRGWEVPVGLVLAVLAVVAVAVTAAASRGARTASTVLATWVAWLATKHGLVRHDVHHAPGLFVALALVFLAATPARAPRWTGMWVGAAVVCMVIATVTARGRGDVVIDPTAPARHFGTQVSQLASGAQRQRVRARAVDELQLRYDVPGQLLAEIGDATVQVDPYAEHLAWAYGLHLLPMPTEQTYTGWTARLDADNAAAVTGAAAPEYLLRNLRARGFDGRFLPFESPGLQVAELCHYEQVAVQGHWQLMRRTTTNRCGTPVPVATVQVGGTPIAVPDAPAGSLLVARFALRSTVVDRLVRTLWRQQLPVVVVDGVRHRLVAATAGALHLLRVPAGGPVGPHSDRELQVRTLAFVGADDVTVTFEAIPYR